MKILGRYLGSNLIKATLMVLFVFIGLEIFILLATQIDSIGKGSYSVWQAFLYVLLILPQQTYFLFPMAGLLGMLFGLSLLASHSELIIMRAAGVSPVQIMYRALAAGMILIIFMTGVGEVIAPSAKHLAEKRRLEATSSGQAMKTKQGLWLRQGNTFYYIKTIYSTKHFANVSRYEFNDQQQLVNVSYASEGYYQNNRWIIDNVQQSIISSNQVVASFIPQTTWYLAIDPRLLKISLSTPDEMSLTQLSDYIDYQKASHLTSANYEIALWQRLMQPIASLVMMFLAVPFIFGPLRTVTTSLRLVLGVIIGFAFYISNQLFPPLSQVMDFPPFVAVLLPITIFAAIGIMLMRRIR